MNRIDFAQRLINGMNEKFEAIDNLDVLELLNLDDDLKLAYLMSYMALTKDSLITKTKKKAHPIERLEKNISDDNLERLFAGAKAPVIQHPTKDELKELIQRICPNVESDDLSDADYYSWIIDTIRDSIMHEAVDTDDDLEFLYLFNSMENRRLNGLIPYEWFDEYFTLNPVKDREIDSCSISGFYYNPEEEYGKPFLSSEMFLRTILYKVNISGNGSKFKEKEINDFIREKFLEYSYLDVSDEEIRDFNNTVLRREFSIPTKYLVSFCKAKEEVKKDLLERYPGIDVNIRIDLNREELEKRKPKELLSVYNNYQDFFDDLEGMTIKDSTRQLDAMYRFYEYIKNCQNNEDFMDMSLDEKRKDLIMTITGNDGINSDDMFVREKREQQTKELLSIVFFYVYGISTIVMNDKSLNDENYLEFIEESCESGKRQKYLNHIEHLKKLENDYLKLLEKVESGRNNYLGVIDNSSVSEETRNKLRDTFIHEMINLYSKRKDIEDEMDFSFFYKDEDAYLVHKRELDELKNIIRENLRVLIDVCSTNEEKRETLTILASIQDDLKDLEKDFVYGKCNGNEAKELLRNCLSHIGRITYAGPYTLEVCCGDVGDNGKESGELLISSDSLQNIIKRSMDQFTDNKTFHK